MGYTNIKIYNGGIKDWKKSGYELESIKPLPDVEPAFITADQLKQMIQDAGSSQCTDAHGAPVITLLDFRNANFWPGNKSTAQIATNCEVMHLQLDDLLKPEVRAKIPKDGKLVSITETGNRDIFVRGFLSKYGYNDIAGLQFGMRGWIKKGYPTQ